MPRLDAVVILADGKCLMGRKSHNRSFDETVQMLRDRGFQVVECSAVQGGVLATKNGAGAVLVPGRGAAMALWEGPGAVIGGQVARLLDRGYQKFLKSSQYEFPATAAQLQGIHAFSEELSQVTGSISLYNEALGTTSDLYEYDRLKGREPDEAAARQPWELADGH